MAKIRIRRGTKSELSAITLSVGELGFATDTKEVYVGDGIANILSGRAMLGTLGDRPTPQVPGRVYHTTDTAQTFVDTGTAWDEVGNKLTDLDNRYVNTSGDIMTGDLEARSFSKKNNNNNCVVLNPDGAFYDGQNIETGAIKIVLPVGWNGDMIQFTLNVFENSTGKTAHYIIGGYLDNGNYKWANVSAIAVSQESPKQVHFGYDSNAQRAVIWIGGTNSTFNYPSIQVTNFVGGFSANINNWKTGWSISFDTNSPTNVSENVVNPSPAIDWDSVYNNASVWTANNDGAGSGLDADLLDGYEATYFAPQASTYSKTEVNDLLEQNASDSLALTIALG